MDNYFEPINSPIGIGVYPMLPPSTRNIYNVDFGYENNFLRKNMPIPYTPHRVMSGLNTPNAPKREINMTNKILIQNNNNLYVNDNGDNINKSKKPEALNMELIQNTSNDIGGGYPPFFGVGDNTFGVFFSFCGFAFWVRRLFSTRNLSWVFVVSEFSLCILYIILIL